MMSPAQNQQTQRLVEVVVPTDPATAFRLFTEEIGEWWVPGPINFFTPSALHEWQSSHNSGVASWSAMPGMLWWSPKSLFSSPGRA